MFEALAEIYSYFFLDIAESQRLKVQEKVKVHVGKLLSSIKWAYGGAGLRVRIPRYLRILRCPSNVNSDSVLYSFLSPTSSTPSHRFSRANPTTTSLFKSSPALGMIPIPWPTLSWPFSLARQLNCLNVSVLEPHVGQSNTDIHSQKNSLDPFGQLFPR